MCYTVNDYATFTNWYDSEVESATLTGYTDFCGKRILEVGCGTGRLTFQLMEWGAKIVAVDKNEEFIKYLNEHKVNNCISACCSDWTYEKNISNLEEEKFDIVIFSWSLYQMKPFVEFSLYKAMNYLAENGILIILQPYGGNYEKIMSKFTSETVDYVECSEKIKIFSEKLRMSLVVKDINSKFIVPSIDDFLMSASIFIDSKLGSDDKKVLLNDLKRYIGRDGKVVLSDHVKCFFLKRTRSIDSIISGKIRQYTRSLREKYYKTNIEKKVYNIPFGGKITESIGPWPEFILKGRFCKRALGGYCSPCFYSRFAEIEGGYEQINKQLIEQCDYVMDNFDKLVINNQTGKVTYNRLLFDNQPLCMVFTPTGSYFDNNEYPQQIRLNILSKLIEKGKEINRKIILYIESHVDDVNNYAFSMEEGKLEIKLLKELNARVILGFESSSNFTRNVLYNKNLSLTEYLKAVSKLKEYGLPVGSFVFAGISPMNNLETIEDVEMSLEFLKANEISPVLMFHNIQEFTIQEFLYKNDVFDMLEPRTLQEIVMILLKLFSDSRREDIDPWLIADPVGGPPKPKYNIFENKKKVTCDKCSRIIYSSICNLRTSRNKDAFINDVSKVDLCSCKNDYIELINREREEKKILLSKAVDMIDLLDSKLS